MREGLQGVEEGREKKINWHEGYIAAVAGSPTWLRHC
jgi:hypothetical protein